jgi:hypothetical protein
MYKVIIGTLLVVWMLAGAAEAAPLTGCCHANGAWMCGMACWETGHSQAPRASPPHSRLAAQSPPTADFSIPVCGQRRVFYHRA